MKKSGNLSTAEWENDRKLVMTSGAPFQVKLLGVVEVAKGRGVDVCEAAIHSLKGSTKNKRRLVVTVRADCIKSVDEETNEVVFEQPIEKVSFCSPYPGHTRLFSYIAREPTKKSWICHCFASMKDPGERVCHAMGCAFTACMRRQQSRIAELNKIKAARKAEALEKAKKEAEEAAEKEKEVPVRLGLSSGAELLFDDEEIEDMLDPSQMASAPVEADKTTLALEKAIEEVEKALQMAKVKADEVPDAADAAAVSSDTGDVEVAGESVAEEQRPVVAMTNPFSEELNQ